MDLPPLIKNIVEKININLKLSGWLSRINSPTIKTTIHIAKVEQRIQQVFVAQATLPDLMEQGAQSVAQLRQPTALLPSSISDAVIVEATEEDKKVISKRIDEAVALLNLGRINEAHTALLTILGEVKNKQVFVREQARVYNNLGVVYNRPKPEGDYDKAIEYFNAALEKDASFVKAKMNVASAYLNKDTPESIRKGHDLVRALWSIEKNPETLQILLWGIYKLSSAEDVFKFIKTEATDTEHLIDSKDTLLNLLAALHLESGRFEESLNYVEKALAMSPNEPELVGMKARGLLIRAQQNNQIPSEFDIVPRFNDYRDVKEALELFFKAEKTAEAQNKPYLLAEIRYGVSTCLTWLGKYDESKHKLKQIQATPDLPELLAHQVSILDFARHLHNRDFETAYNTLTGSDAYLKLDYREKRRISRVFLLNGAPEQAKLLSDEVVLEAEQGKDIHYWFDLSSACVLLGKQQEAISAATRAKNLSAEMDTEVRKTAFSHFNAVNYHYSKPEDGENSETGRLVQGMMEFQQEFPEEKIITPIPALDEQGQLTTEIKDMFTSLKGRYENIRETFKKNPIPAYYLEKTFHRTFASEIAFRNDPEFTLEITSADQATIEELNKNFSESTALAFDYLSLLDLAKMDFLGFLERLGKPIFVHEKLFQKAQEELLQNEIEELRTLWNFLRKSKVVQIIRGDTEIELKSERLGDFFDEWLVETIKYAKAQNATLVTNDFRLYRFLKSEEDRKSVV